VSSIAASAASCQTAGGTVGTSNTRCAPAPRRRRAPRRL